MVDGKDLTHDELLEEIRDILKEETAAQIIVLSEDEKKEIKALLAERKGMLRLRASLSVWLGILGSVVLLLFTFWDAIKLLIWRH